jgi:hypothetical protein
MMPSNHPSAGCHRISRNGIDWPMANNAARNIFSLVAFTLQDSENRLEFANDKPSTAF